MFDDDCIDSIESAHAVILHDQHVFDFDGKRYEHTRMKIQHDRISFWFQAWRISRHREDIMFEHMENRWKMLRVGNLKNLYSGKFASPTRRHKESIRWCKVLILKTIAHSIWQYAAKINKNYSPKTFFFLDLSFYPLLTFSCSNNRSLHSMSLLNIQNNQDNIHHTCHQQCENYINTPVDHTWHDLKKVTWSTTDITVGSVCLLAWIEDHQSDVEWRCIESKKSNWKIMQ